MKTKKYIVSLFSVMIMFVLTSSFLPDFHTVSAQANSELKYTVLDNGVRIDGMKDDFFTGESVTVPAQIEGKNVTSIAKKAFMNKKTIKTIVLPDTITTIGSNAFNNCIELKDINIPTGLKEIGDFAFYMCKNIETLTLPQGVTEIHENTFCACEKLKTVTLPQGLKLIDKNAFDFCSSLTDINIPNSVTTIGNQAFSNCKALEMITIPDSVTDIGEMVFKDCEKLKDVTLSNKITTLKRGIFKHCSSISVINIPESVEIIENGVFEGCSSIETISLSRNVRTIAPGCLVDCVKLKEIKVDSQNEKFYDKDGVLFNTQMKELVFYPAAKPDKVYDIPDGVQGIAAYAFYHNKSLTSVRIPKNVTYIAQNSFDPAPDEILIAADSPALIYAKKYFTKYTIYNNKTGKTKSVNKNLIMYISITVAVVLIAGLIVYNKLFSKKAKAKKTVEKEKATV